MSIRRLLLVLTLVCVSCKPGDAPGPGKPAAGPQMRATVVTIRTTVTPAKTEHTQTLVISGDRARNLSETDTWRLFDTKANTVTFVDDLAKTVHTEPLATLTQRRRTANAAALPPHYPKLELVRTGTKKPIQNASAEQAVVTSGKYKRELWLAEHPSIPKGLFAMMHASEPVSSPLAPMMRAVDEALLTTPGFPLSDRSEIPLGSGEMVVERTVVSIEQKEVPESVLAVPKGYKDVTPKPAAAGKKK